ncbi:hypothetical protein LPB142_13280 [Rhodobacter xanthinilyticus]|uniref:DUF1150 domain-containing protein n=1 Tax=Rhodobacter xanthinilyticus TaxID=1850250 RepID=A0A1D9MEJ6_9RHOB|nr:DUF1150 family protein [Rhodobacter xanthinilyticus]AOZ70169.1 hypothetical protein LPB142_13280 [Rhodobacter xanthinilyticus]
MHAPYDLGAGPENRIVYIRPVAVAELPAELRERAPGVDKLYALCDESGARLALVTDRRLAFVLARQHDFAAVSVH